MSAPLKADVTAADRLLKAAVRRAVAMIREADVEHVKLLDGTTIRTLVLVDRQRVVETLTHAGESAALLLGEAS